VTPVHAVRGYSLVTKLPPQMAWVSHWAKAAAKFSMSFRLT
jgi:hypothetical protein